MSRSRRSPKPRSPQGVSLSQHQLRSTAVARRIVARTGLAPPDVVYEAGAGTGTLTAALAERAGCVVAIERERAAWQALKARFDGDPRVTPVLGDFLDAKLPAAGDFVVVSNVPFSITTPLIRRLVALPNPPRAAHLVVQREAAYRWAGVGRETVVSVAAKVRFEPVIELALHRADFTPRPSVDCVLLTIARRGRPLLDPAAERRFRAFVETGFGRGRRTARRNLDGQVGYRAFVRAARELGFDRDAAPGELSFAQWLGLFRRSPSERRRGGPPA